MTNASDYLAYGDAILITPQLLYDVSDAIAAIGGALMAAAHVATTAVEGLNETWISSSASEAQDFTRKLKDDLVDLFGNGDASSSGALAAYANFLQATAGAFDQTEKNLQKTWSTFTGNLLSTSSGANSSVSSDASDTAITYS